LPCKSLYHLIPADSLPFHIRRVSMSSLEFSLSSHLRRVSHLNPELLPMADIATSVQALPHGGSLLDKKMKKSPAWISAAVVLIALLGGLGYVGFHIADDLGNVTLGSVWPYLLLGAALLIALGFEFVNGFHDTANAVATVIYTHSLEPNLAVVWSGLCNLTGVLASTGTVAFAIITLLP